LISRKASPVFTIERNHLFSGQANEQAVLSQSGLSKSLVNLEIEMVGLAVAR
jgi:hypothetical protein